MPDTSTNDAGRHDEFVRLLNAAHRRLVGYLVSLLGNRHDAEDVLQRASVTMWRKFGTFASGPGLDPAELTRDFLAWASTVAFYEAKNFQRMTMRSKLCFSDELLKTLSDERAPDLTHTDARHEALGHCLEKLDEPGRRLVEAAYLDGCDIGMLAEQLGRARQTLYNKLNIIRRSLADCVTRHLAAEGLR